MHERREQRSRHPESNPALTSGDLSTREGERVALNRRRQAEQATIESVATFENIDAAKLLTALRQLASVLERQCKHDQALEQGPEGHAPSVEAPHRKRRRLISRLEYLRP